MFARARSDLSQYMLLFWGGGGEEEAEEGQPGGRAPGGPIDCSEEGLDSGGDA